MSWLSQADLDVCKMMKSPNNAFHRATAILEKHLAILKRIFQAGKNNNKNQMEVRKNRME
jgi:hypothetical protein